MGGLFWEVRSLLLLQTHAVNENLESRHLF